MRHNPTDIKEVPEWRLPESLNHPNVVPNPLISIAASDGNLWQSVKRSQGLVWESLTAIGTAGSLCGTHPINLGPLIRITSLLWEPLLLQREVSAQSAPRRNQGYWEVIPMLLRAKLYQFAVAAVL